MVSGMVDDGHLDEAFEGRPFAYNSKGLKVMILMTDGMNTSQYEFPTRNQTVNIVT